MYVRAAHVAAIGAASLIILSTSTTASETPTSAQEQANTSAAPATEERYCETITMTGSRLAKRRFCGTRAEWAEKRLQDRQAIERTQTQLCVYSKTGPTGRPSC